MEEHAGPLLYARAMATKTIVSVLDDIDGTEGAETVSFALDGKSYEIDLSDKNLSNLQDALEPYIKVARSTSSSRRSTEAPQQSQRGGGRKDLAAIREWANKNGHNVSDRGRVPASVIEAYDAAN